MLKKYEHDLISNDNTEVFYSDDIAFNAPNQFEVRKTGDKETEIPLEMVNFQTGAIKEVGLNGVFNEDLIAMVICRLEHFQKSEFACRENAIAITKLEESLMWLRKRTMNRNKRGVLGTYNK